MTAQKESSPIEFLLKYEDVFQEGLATMWPFKATLCLNSDAVPRFHKPDLYFPWARMAYLYACVIVGALPRKEAKRIVALRGKSLLI